MLKHLVRLPRWLLFLGSGLIFLISLLGYFGTSAQHVCNIAKGKPDVCHTRFFPDLNTSSLQLRTGSDFSALFIFLLCGTLFCLICWVVLSTKIERRFYWLACLLQGGLVLIATLAIEGDGVVFGDAVALALYVMLCMQALVVLKHLRPVFLVATGYFLLFALGKLLAGSWLYFWQVQLPLLGYLIMVPLLVTLVTFYVTHIRAHNRLAATHQQLEAAFAELAVSTQQIEALTLLTERQRIARDLHDTLSQDLVGMIRQLDIVEKHLTLQNSARALALVQDAAQSARSALTEARWTIENLRMRTEDVACSEALLQEIERFQTATGIACTYDLAALTNLPATAREQVLGMVREGLTNIARHAQAQQVWILAAEGRDRLTIEIRDDGVGFDQALSKNQRGHYGLPGLRERARLLGGEIEIHSQLAKGTILAFSLPNLTQRESVSHG